MTSVPEPVTGYGAVGVTWDGDTEAPTEEISFEVRTRTDDAWSDWSEIPYDADHGPDPGSPEAKQVRPGTDVVMVGKVDQVQVRSSSPEGAPPEDMQMAVISPGEPEGTKKERAAIVTSDDGVSTTSGAEPGTGPDTGPDTGRATGSEDALDLQAATFTPKPKIYSRKQWGANERLRDKGSLRYFEVHAGFVHHTVNANNYSRAEVPGILRSIYAYHTQSRGWSDVGYNFLVDRFGRIWEGRAGGVDRPVVGAHTLGYNDYSFAMSAIGNFETARPTSAMLQAYGALFAWKLSLHGVDAESTRQLVGSRSFRAINGHRDAGSTACPGRHLYAKLSVIRQYAGAAQRGWAGRELESDLASTRHPDLIVRRASDGQAFILPTGGLVKWAPAVTLAGAVADASAVVGSPDLTGDAYGDVVVRAANGAATVRPGSASGFGGPIKPTEAFAGRDLITAVGDLDEDGLNDLVARNIATEHLNAYLGDGTGGFTRQSVSGEWGGYDKLAATGDVNGDGHVDLLARDGSGRLWLHAGTGGRSFAAAKQVPGNWDRLDTITGFGDFTRDGRPDLIVRRQAGTNGFIKPGRGNGTFGRGLGPFTRLQAYGSISGVGNTAGNAAPDLVARRGSDLVTLPHGGSFHLGKPVATGVDISSANLVLNPGDWDRDGHGDLLYRRGSDGSLWLRRGEGDGRFGSATNLAKGFGSVRLLAAVGDMTGDGRPDLMGQPRGGSLRIYPGLGLAGLRASYVAHRAVTASRQVSVGRWDADGAPDTLFRNGDRLTMYRGNGPGGLTEPKRLDVNLAPYSWVIGVSDINLTGHADLIVRSSGNLFVLRANARGFHPRLFLGEGMGAYDLAG